MNTPYLQHAFSRENKQEKELRTKIGKKFVHIAAAYPNLHTVRIFYDKDTANKVAERVAEKAEK